MAYIALYRQWRPQCFADVVGQQHVVKTLQNELQQGRIAHAYLFCGPRGTGKTSMAKILAKALNCMEGPQKEPCNQCELCEGITKGCAADVVEIDAASNRGIDEIRELREKIKFAPAQGKYKIYIIDEIHMLTTEAFNALLKTLEEPPAHVVFVLATTEAHKLPTTILSRCQRFDFHRLSLVEMTERLKEITAHQNVSVDLPALQLVARAADGGMRDALSLLDQCIAIGDGQVSLEDVESILGRVNEELYFDVLQAIVDNKLHLGLEMIQQLYNEGKDLPYFLQGLTEHLRNLLVTKACQGGIEGLIQGDAAFVKRLQQQAEQCPQERLLSMLAVLGQANSEMKWTAQPRILLETTLIKLAQVSYMPDLEVLVRRIEQLENAANHDMQNNRMKIKSGYLNETDVKHKQGDMAEPCIAQDSNHKQPFNKIENSSINISETRDGKDDLSSLSPQQWEEILQAVRQEHILTHAWLIEGKPEKINDDTLIISFEKKYGFHKENIEKAESRMIIEKAIQKIVNKSLKIHTILKEQNNSQTARVEAVKKDPLVKEALNIFGGEIVELRYDGEEG